MRKFLSSLLAVFILAAAYSQSNKQIKGITITGIKGINKTLSYVIANERTFPANYKVRLKPELEGPEPKGQNPNAKPVSKFGTLITGNNNYRYTSTSAPTQTVASNFLAIWGSYAAVANRESPYTPPDNNGDVGTTQIVATANCRMKVFDKPSVTGAPSTTPTGSSTTTLTPVVNVDLNAFFANATLGINGISDPHVRFDRLTGRWFVVAIDVTHSTSNNYCCIAVSDGSTITATTNFHIFYFNISQTGGSSTDFFDYPTLGVDKNSLYIGGNMFAGGRTFSGCNMWVVNKANLIANTLTVTSFPHGAAATDIYTPQGVHNDDPSSTYGYFVGASQTYYSKLVIKRISYAGGGVPTLSGDLSLTTSTTYTPKTVPTLGGTAIDGNDRRLCAAMIKKNKISGATNLWVAQGTLLNKLGVGGSTGDRDGALWMEITNLQNVPSILQGGVLYDSINATSSAINYTYPTIALSGQGHNVMGFTSAGANKYAQAAVAGRYRTDPAGNMQSSVDITNTTSTYNPGANRWGDYTQTVVDPTDDMTMWTFTEYAPGTNSWGVRAAQFKAPPPATPVLATTPLCGATTNVTINGTAGNNPNSEFFDPGADAAGGAVAYTHLKVDVSGPSSVTVSNVKFVNPTQIKADFNVPLAAAAGTYTVTVTNPDGQTSSSTFNLSCAPPLCGDPTGLNSSSVTNNNATVNWTGVTNAISYDVDYKIHTDATWVNAATATTATSVSISSLTQGTVYDWRVRATCAAGSGNYVLGSFTTTAPCNPPTTLPASNLTNSSATVNWNAVQYASTYNVDYRVQGATSWTNAVTGITATSVNLTGLSASTAYEWQVTSNCGTNGNSASSAGPQFNTTAVVTCPENYEPNNTSATAATITINTNVNAQISSGTDVDYYSFSTSGSQKNLKVTLTSPYNSSVTLYSSNGTTVLGTSVSGTSGSVVYNSNKSSTYKVKVVGTSATDFSSTQCYTLRVTTASTTFTAATADVSNNIHLVRGGLKLYPVPATNAVNISFDAYAKGTANVTIINQLGQPVLIKTLLVNDGTNFNTLDVSALKSGVYTLKVNNGKEIQTQKIVISK